MLELILASASPRRLNILEALGIRCEVSPQDIDESALPGEQADVLVERLAKTKARAAVTVISETDHRLVLGADTIVVCEGRILGKPEHKDDGLAMLRLLSGRTHQVLTAVCVMSHEKQAETMSVSTVSFASLSEAEIEAYWQSGEPAGKAGAYAIQGLGAMFVNDIQGSYSGIVGLPIFETANLLKIFGIDVTTILQKQ